MPAVVLVVHPEHAAQRLHPPEAVDVGVGTVVEPPAPVPLEVPPAGVMPPVTFRGLVAVVEGGELHPVCTLQHGVVVEGSAVLARQPDSVTGT